MFRQTFIRLIVLGTFAFALCFVLVSAQKAREKSMADCEEPETKTEKARPSGEFILEKLAGSIMFGIR